MQGAIRLLVVWLVLGSAGLAAAQPAPAPDPAGFWTGTLTCPAGPSLPFSVAIYADGARLRAVLFSPSQLFATELAAARMIGTDLELAGPVPGGAPVTLRGPIAGADWRPTLTQGALACPGAAKRAALVATRLLPIPPAYQATPMWCWLAVGEMIFSTFSVPTGKPPGAESQCKIMQTIYQDSPQLGQCALDCRFCGQLGAGSSREFAGMLSDFPRRMAQLSRSQTPRLFVTPAPVLPAAEVEAEVQAGRPVAIGISPSQTPQTSPVTALPSLNQFFPPQHVALIVGFLRAGGEIWYRVNDPYPFPIQPAVPAVLGQNPYVVAGALPQIDVRGGAIAVTYWIREAHLKQALRWRESFLIRVDGRHQP